MVVIFLLLVLLWLLLFLKTGKPLEVQTLYIYKLFDSVP